MTTRAHAKRYAVRLAAFQISLLVGVIAPDRAHACADDAECKGARICRDGACQDPPTCRADVDCEGDAICSDGRCAPPAAVPVAPASPAPTAEPPPPPASAPAASLAAPAMVPPAATTNPASPAADGGPTRATRTEGIKGLIIAGPITLGVAWALGIVGSLVAGADGDLVGYAAIPLAGPWIMLADDRTEEYTAALAIGGALQAAGATMTVLGLTIRHEVSDDTSLVVTPMPGGVFVGGTF